MKIVVVTMMNEWYSEIAKASLPNMAKYCQRHGYEDAVIKLNESEGFHYKKHEFFKEAFKTDIDLIFYKDIDTVITNLTILIESFIDDEHGMFVTTDTNGINGGVMILKNTEAGRWANEIILSLRDKFNNEQEVIEFLIKDPQFNDHVKVVPHPGIHSIPYEHYPQYGDVTHGNGNWEEGDFLIHVPALTFEQRATILNKVKIKE